MSASRKLITSVKALSCLSNGSKLPKQSKDVAIEIQCNASKLRSLFSLLVKANILESIQGVNGGFRLQRDPDHINLQQIYCAIEDRKAFHMDFTEGENSPHYEHYFENLFQQIQTEIEEKMSKITLTDINDKIKRNDYGFLKEVTY